MTPEQQIEAGQRAKIADEVLSEAFNEVLGGYAARLIEVAASEPWAVDKIRSMALAQKIGEAVRAHIRATAAGEAIGRDTMDYRRRIERMSPERRNILGL